MNRSSSIKTNTIAENCRSILRERCYTQRTSNHFSQQCKPSHTFPTNPIYSPYGIDNLSYCNTRSSMIPPNNFVRHPNCIDRNLAPMQPILNRQTSHVQYLSVPSDNCIQMITNGIITKIRYKVSQEDIALLRSCLPSLIRQIMCKSPWLTPNDVIQWLSEDIIKEAMNHFNDKDSFHQSQQDHTTENNDSLSSYRSASSQESILSQHSSRSILDKKPTESRDEQRVKKNEDRSPSTRSFSSRQSNNSKLSTKFSPQGNDNKSKKSEKINPSQIEEDERSISSRHNDSNLSLNTFDSNENFDQKSIKMNNQSQRNHIEFPGKKDPNAIQDVEKCLAFYHKIREYFDDDVAAMLLKCCLCYGDCSTKR